MDKIKNPILATDSYKLSHKNFQKDGVAQIYSNFTPRFNKYFKELYPDSDSKVVWYGFQGMLKQVFLDYWDDNFFKKDKYYIISEANSFLDPYIRPQDLSHFEDLHDLGYMPLHIKGLPEGSLVDINVPCFTVTNTHPDFAWLPNFLESFMTTQLWKTVVIATAGRQFKLLSDQFAEETTGSTEGAEFQNHDFSYRGQSGTSSAGAVGSGFLLSSSGTDNIPAISYIEDYYNTDVSTNPVAFSVPASEHSVTTLGIHMSEGETLLEKEQNYLEYVLDKFPTGIVSYVSDSYDYFGVISEIIPSLKDKILARDGKLVVRPDSGNPVEIIAGIEVPDFTEVASSFNLAAITAVYDSVDTDSKEESVSSIYKYQDQILKVTAKVSYKDNLLDNVEIGTVESYTLSVEEKGTVEHLWDVFGGTISDTGYKLLDSHIGMIYGDGITYQRSKEILTRLKNKGFASTNVIFGIGSYSLASSVSRDTLGIAFKATMSVLEDGTEVPIFKAPKTDSSKKSAKGFLKVVKEDSKFVLYDNVSAEEESEGELKTVFYNGDFIIDENFHSIKERLYPSK